MSIKYGFVFAGVMFTSGVLFGQQASATSGLKQIKATSKKVSINDNGEMKKDYWTITPELKPDVYVTNTKNGKVVFYTDKDSIVVKVNEKRPYDFVIVLNDTIKALTQVKYKQPFLEVLKASNVYNRSDKRVIPEFTYQDSMYPALVTLRKELKLDSIAGGGNELSKIINLMHWIHYLVPHDGQNGNPDVKNALSMVSVCRKEKRGMNCRGLATVLNECYLAMGIKSRFLTCLPKDTTDSECHVINMVYSNDLKKWIWMDPTNDAYVMDEKGTLLGPEEVRLRLITNKPLLLNPDANWNRRLSVGKDYLSNYMAKNLYRFECPVHSEYDTETKARGKRLTYVQLIPTDYYYQTPDKSEEEAKNSGVIFVEYKTNNPEWFWQIPK